MKWFLLLLISFPLLLQAQVKGRYQNEVELFSIWTSGAFLHEGQQSGVNLKLSYEIEPFFWISGQSTYFHPSTRSEFNYTELRTEWGIYIAPLAKYRFSPFLYIGMNIGYWQREYTVDFGSMAQADINEIHSTNYIDQSGSFGFGFYYDINPHRIVVEHHFAPDIYQNYTSLGVQFRIFKGDNRSLRTRRRKIK